MDLDRYREWVLLAVLQLAVDAGIELAFDCSKLIGAGQTFFQIHNVPSSHPADKYEKLLARGARFPGLSSIIIPRTEILAGLLGAFNNANAGLEAHPTLSSIELEGMGSYLRFGGCAADRAVPVFAEGADALGAGDDDVGHNVPPYLKMD